MSDALRPRWRWEGLIVPVTAIALAEIAAQVTHLQSDILAAPSGIAAAGFHGLADGSILIATGETLTSAAIGLAIGVGLGIFFGTILGIVPVLNRMLEFTIEAMRPIPAVAIIPVALLVFGFGYRMEYSIVAFATFWTTLILTRSAVGNIEPRLFEVSRILGLGFFARLTKIFLPAALPRIFVAFRLAIGISLIVAVTVEIASNTIGVGYRMMEAQTSLHPDLGLAYLVWVGLLGWAINALLLWAQRSLFGRMGNVGVDR
jgi:ABC-type nitrate/sulfonate/bicarbonate transport system permease component